MTPRTARVAHERTTPREERFWLVIAAMIVLVGALAFATALAPPAHAAPAKTPAPAAATASTAAKADAVVAVGLTVSDMDRSVAFFHDVLTFERVSDVEVTGESYERLQGVFALRMRVVRMRLGDEAIELTEYLAPHGHGRPDEARSNDRWFQHVAIIVSDMDAAYARLREHRVEHVSPGPQRLPDWNKNAGGISAFYFRDPDGHALEVLSFPPEKGDPKWHRPAGGRLFLGIDHTAIVVSDTEKSLAFYRDLLGMRVAGASENYGPEQERLNSVFGARLRITALRGAAGPGIEFLQYLAPGGGRPYPVDERANDLMHWQTQLLAPNVGALVARLKAAGTPFVSPGTVALPETSLGFHEGALVRDPDGHAVQLISQDWSQR